MSEVNKLTLHQNSMEAKFKIEHPPVRFDTSNSLTEIRVSRTDTIEKNVEIFPKDSGKRDKEVEITPLDVDDIEVQLVLPHTNCMEAIFELVEPEILTEELIVDKDSFTRSLRPYNVENYGKQNALSLLNGEQDTRKTFVYFHLPLWFLPVVSVSTAFRLYYRGTINEEKLALYTAHREWSEYGITQANEPNRLGLVTKTYTVNSNEKYIEFDVTEIINYWKTYPHLNFGFRLEIETENNLGLNFYSRESLFKPMLIANYYDPSIKSVGRSNSSVELETYYKNHNDTESQITVKSAFENSDTEVQLLPYTKGDTLPNDDDVLITVTKPSAPVDIKVAVPEESTELVEISPKLQLSSGTEADLIITKNHTPVEVYVAEEDDIEVEIQARAHSNQEVELDIVQADYKEVQLDVNTLHDTESIIAITRGNTEVEINAVYSDDSDIPVEIRPKVKRHSNKETQIAVNRKEALVELVVPVLSDMPVDIRVKGWNHNDNEALLTVIRDNIEVEILAKAILEDREVVLWIPDDSDKEVIIQNRPHNDKHTEIEVYLSDKKEVVIASKRDEIFTQIGVYFDGEREELVEITPSIRASKDAPVQIMLRGEIKGYAFIM